MISGLSRFDAGLVRSFKEVLFRFLEEVQSTKAALYLLDGDLRFGLVCQYGFGRRDALAAEHATDGPLGALACGSVDGPQYFNQKEAVPELVTYLQGAGTERFLLAPLRLGGVCVGLVDVRDKGRRRPFSETDAAHAAEIARALLQLVSQADLYPTIGPQSAAANATGPAAAAQSAPARVEAIPGRAVDGAGDAGAVDAVGLEELVGLAADMVPSAGVVAVALSLVRGGRGATALLVPRTAPEPEQSLIMRHQEVALRQIGMPAPEPNRWVMTMHRVDGCPGRLRARHVASAVLRHGTDWGLVGSVLLDAEGSSGPVVLGRLTRAAAAARTGSRLRLAGRLAARRLLPSDEHGLEGLEEHCIAVSRLSWAMARILGLGQLEIERAAVAGLVHDVGIRRIAGAGAHRNEALGAQDRRRYQAHVEHGAEMIARLFRDETGQADTWPGRGDREPVAACDGSLEEVSVAVRHHHERWDGQGYPDRLAGTAIPLLSRLVHVAEVYDVLTAPHSYRRTVGRSRALGILRASAGSQLDPQMVEALAGVVA